jgi:hypothetical protein
MSVAIATIGRMAERITLEQLAGGIADLGTIIQAGFAYNEAKFREMEARFANIENRLSAIEYGIREMQKDFVALDEEIRGIHKVIDNLNVRIVALERNFGARPLFPAG